MSHYGDMYRAQEEENLIRAYAPDWSAGESHRVRVELARGYKARKELRELKDALQVVRKIYDA